MTNYVDDNDGDDMEFDEDDYEAAIPYNYLVNW
jgi:hypothetical protein